MGTIGIDIGGTQTRIALFEGNEMRKHVRLQTNTADPDAHIAKITKVIAELTSEYTAIGVACPGPLDSQGGVVLTPPNLPGWHGFALRETLEKTTGKPVVIENDANLAAFAEAMVGAGKGRGIVQFLTVSTGIGAGLIINETIFQGAHGFAQEVANCVVDEQNNVQGATIAGSVERICSGTGIYACARQAGLAVETTADVFALSRDGNDESKALLDYTAEKMATFVAMIQGVVDPHVIVIGGSVALQNPAFIAEIETRAKQKVYPTIAPYLRFELARCGDDAGLIGAALWAEKQAYVKEGLVDGNYSASSLS